MGIIIGLLAALTHSSTFVFLKKLDGVNPNFLTWLRNAVSLPVIALFVTFFEGWSVPALAFWLFVALLVPLEVALAYFGTRAVQISDISVVGPLASLSAAFMVPIGYIMLGEVPTLMGLLGILSIIIGSFFLGWEKGEKPGASWLRLFRDRGVHLALLAAFLGSVAIGVTKAAFAYTTPVLAGFYITAALFAALFPIAVFQGKRELRPRAGALAGVSISDGLGNVFHYFGLSLLPTAYFVSIKRLSILFDVLFGKVVFKEKNITSRFIGAALLVGGVVLITFGL